MGGEEYLTGTLVAALPCLAFHQTNPRNGAQGSQSYVPHYAQDRRCKIRINLISTCWGVSSGCFGRAFRRAFRRALLEGWLMLSVHVRLRYSCFSTRLNYTYRTAVTTLGHSTFAASPSITYPPSLSSLPSLLPSPSRASFFVSSIYFLHSSTHLS